MVVFPKTATVAQLSVHAQTPGQPTFFQLITSYAEGPVWIPSSQAFPGRIASMEPLLRVFDLCVQYREGANQWVRALRGASLRAGTGEVVGILGESGSGKSTLAKTLLQLLPPAAVVTGGGIEFKGRTLLGLTPKEMTALRGARISLIPQDAGLALTPFLKVGKQIAEVLRAHQGFSWRRCCDEAEELLDLVQLSSEGRRMFNAYPHQLSGGEQQRVAIAQAISCRPELVIADEPTASLDSETEAAILYLLRSLRNRFQMSLLFITHRPRILEGLAHRVAVMYAGRVVEEGPASEVLEGPRHPYTRALLACGARRMAGARDDDRESPLPTIPGDAPDGRAFSSACAFAPRCASRMEDCENRPPARTGQPEIASVECLLYEH